MKILLAIDHSKQSEDAVCALPRFFNPEGSEVRIVEVLPPLVISTHQPGEKGSELNSPAKHARALGDKYAQLLRGWRFQVRVHVERGDVVDSIVHSAASWPADVILIGAGRRNLGGRFLLGSVAESVVKRAPCAVMLVPEGTDPPLPSDHPYPENSAVNAT